MTYVFVKSCFNKFCGALKTVERRVFSWTVGLSFKFYKDDSGNHNIGGIKKKQKRAHIVQREKVGKPEFVIIHQEPCDAHPAEEAVESMTFGFENNVAWKNDQYHYRN